LAALRATARLSARPWLPLLGEKAAFGNDKTRMNEFIAAMRVTLAGSHDRCPLISKSNREAEDVTG